MVQTGRGRTGRPHRPPRAAVPAAAGGATSAGRSHPIRSLGVPTPTTTTTPSAATTDVPRSASDPTAGAGATGTGAEGAGGQIAASAASAGRGDVRLFRRHRRRVPDVRSGRRVQRVRRHHGRYIAFDTRTKRWRHIFSPPQIISFDTHTDDGLFDQAFTDDVMEDLTETVTEPFVPRYTLEPIHSNELT